MFVVYMSIKYQHQEAFNDKWIVEKIFPKKRNGYFVDAGANVGIDCSCSYVLEKNLNWKGICIEAGLTFDKLKKNRSCITVNKALYDDSVKTVEFQECQNTWVSGVASELDRCFKTYGKDYHVKTESSIRKVETITLLDLLNKNKAPNTIEYLHMDIEGSEKKVLEHYFQHNTKYTILAMSIEGSECNELLEKNGYIHVMNPFNTQAPWEQYFLHPSIANKIQK